MRRGGTRSPLPWLAGLLVLYLGVPVVAFCVRLITTDSRGFHDPGLFPALAVSVSAASITTALATLCGVPLAYLLARSKGRLAAAIGMVVLFPLAVPPVMGGVLLIYLVGPYTWLGRLFDGGLTGTLAGVVLAQTFVAAPFLVVAARSSFASVDPALGDVAATLGHGRLSRFLRVDVAVAAPGIRAGMVLTWLRAFGEYGATVVLAYHPTSLPVYTFTQFSATGLPGTMAPTALALGVAVVAVALSRLLLVRLRHRRREGSVAPAATRRPVPAPGTPIGFALTHQLGAFHLGVDHAPTAHRLAVLGPSGSGKSTLLRCVAGLYGPDPGPVSFGDRRVDGVPVERRRVGYVAQTFALFPHLTVWEHLLFGTDADAATAAYWLAHLRLEGLEGRRPDQLSGGQRQRVALAQALSRSPDVLLLDEPFSALDTPVRHELQRELRRLQRETGVSTVLVTHDPEEAALLADEVLVIEGGRAIQDGPTREVFRRPASPAAARLVGVANLCHGAVAGPGVVTVAGATVGADTGTLPPGTPVLWSVRPETLRLSVADGRAGTMARAGATEPSWVSGAVADVADIGWATEVLVALDGPVGPSGQVELRVRVLDDQVPVLGARCAVEVPAEAVSVWAAPENGQVPGTTAGALSGSL